MRSLAFSPDGTRIASGSDDHTVKLWDAASGNLVRTFDGHSGPVAAVAFSPDGTRIASGASNVAIEVWDAASGTLLASLRIWDGEGLAYTPAGLFVGDVDPQDAFAIVRGFEVLPLDNFSPSTAVTASPRRSGSSPRRPNGFSSFRTALP